MSKALLLISPRESRQRFTYLASGTFILERWGLASWVHMFFLTTYSFEATQSACLACRIIPLVVCDVQTVWQRLPYQRSACHHC
jgi:hypothetical protein